MTTNDHLRGRSRRLVAYRLPFPLLLASRYLRSTRRDAFISFLSAVAAGGIGLGVAALVVALAALTGLQDALRDEVLARTPEIEVELPNGLEVSAVAAQLAALREVEEVQEVVRGRGWLRWGRMVQQVELVGYSGELPRFFPGAAGEPGGLFVSRHLADRWGVEQGQVVEVISPRITLSPFGPQPRLRSMPLTGTFLSGRTEEAERVAVPMSVARPLAGGASTYLELYTGGLDRALALVPAVTAAVPDGAVIRTWRELNRPLFFALRLEKMVMFVAVALIVVVAAMALVADLALVISSKRGELGMLSTMGATPRSLQAAFLALGGLLAGIGMTLGSVLGAAVATLLDRFRLVRLPRQVYFLDYLPFRVELGDLVSVLALTLLLALGSSLYVAQRAARLRPVEALRR